jgi:hypothetical protein
MKPQRKGVDFSAGRRGAVLPPPTGKTRITIRIDTGVLDWFREQVNLSGGGNYQTLMNDALRQHVEAKHENLEETLRRVLREELGRLGGPRGSLRAPVRTRAAGDVSSTRPSTPGRRRTAGAGG